MWEARYVSPAIRNNHLILLSLTKTNKNPYSQKYRLKKLLWYSFIKGFGFFRNSGRK